MTAEGIDKLFTDNLLSDCDDDMLRLMQSGSYFSHHEYDFRPLLDASDDVDWGTEDCIDALCARFPGLLLLRENV